MSVHLDMDRSEEDVAHREERHVFRKMSWADGGWMDGLSVLVTTTGLRLSTTDAQLASVRCDICSSELARHGRYRCQASLDRAYAEWQASHAIILSYADLVSFEDAALCALLTVRASNEPMRFILLTRSSSKIRMTSTGPRKASHRGSGYPLVEDEDPECEIPHLSRAHPAVTHRTGLLLQQVSIRVKRACILAKQLSSRDRWTEISLRRVSVLVCRVVRYKSAITGQGSVLPMRRFTKHLDECGASAVAYHDEGAEPVSSEDADLVDPRPLTECGSARPSSQSAAFRQIGAEWLHGMAF